MRGRRGSGARHEARARRRPSGPGRGGLHQRPWHLHAGRGPHRGDRGEVGFLRPRAALVDGFHQVHDRTPARRGRRPRSRGLRARPAAGDRPTYHQSRNTGSPMRSRPGSEHGPERETQGRDVELFRVRRSQRVPGDASGVVKALSRRRGGRGRRRARPLPPPPSRTGFWTWLRGLFAPRPVPTRERTLGAQEARVLTEFCRQYGLPFRDLTLLKLALTHRSYLSVTGQGPRESNERLEFLGDSVLGLVTSEFLYRRHPDEHEGQLTKTKSLLVSKAILSRRALRIGLGRFVLMSHSEVESGGRQRLSILADAFESVLGAIYLDQGFEAARTFIHKHLLAESDAITSDKRHTNYKSHLQEYVQNAFRTHPVYRIRSEYGPDHSKHFMVEVMVGRRTLGEGRGHNKKEAEQAAARDALEKVESVRRPGRHAEDMDDRDDRDDHDAAPAGDRGRAP